MAAVFFGILGPVCVRLGGQQSVELSGKQSVVLASLLLNVNATVSRDRLIAALWENAPHSAVSNLQTYVAQLRKVLPAGTRLLTKGSGYLLQASAEEVDLLIFDQEVRLARLAAERGEAGAAAERFERALALWRGQPAEGTPLGGDLLARVAEVEERRTETLLDYAEVKLVLGAHKGIIDDLRRLLAEQPLREKAWYLLMLAHARAGQRDKALDTYRRARDVLVEELGVEPSKDLQDLQSMILGGGLPPIAPEPRVRGICQLPPDIADFVGRQGELASAIEALGPARQRATTPEPAGAEPARIPPTQTVPLCVISGQGGVGKTALAIHIAHHVRHDFPDGQLYMNLRGGENRPTDPEEALGRFLRALEVDSATVPSGLDQRAELYRAKLANGRYLVVLDDAADEGQLYPLLPGTPGCAVLITSRHRLTGLPAARMIDLPMMPSGEALELLRHLIGADRAAEASGDADTLVQLCGGLPLAVRIAGAKLAARPHWGLDQLVTRLSDTRNRLRQLSHGSQAVRASLAVGYQGLTSPARRLFRLLGLVEAQDFAAWSAAALLDMPYAEAEELIEQLVDVRLLDVAGHDPSGQARFRFHDLTRAYARECAETEESENERIAAIRRALSAWLALTRQAHARLCGGDYRLPYGRSPLWSPDPEIVERHVRDPLAWVEAERAGIVTAVSQSAALEADELCWELASSAMHLFETRSFYDEWRATHETALLCARSSGNVRGQATILNGLAGLFLARDDMPRSGEALEEALGLFEKAEDRHGHALVLVNLAELHRLQGRYAQALELYEQATEDVARVGDHGTEIAILRGIGHIHFNQGRHDLAGPYLRRAVRLADDIGDVRSRGFARIILGEIDLARGDSAAAEAGFSQAMAYFDTLGFPRGTAYATLGLASARLAQHDLADAERLLQRALAIYENVGESLGRARVLFAWAELRRLQGRFDEAVATLTDVIAICQAIPAPRRHGLALRALGDVHRDAGDRSAAMDAWRSSLAVLEATSSPEAKEVAALIKQHTDDVL
ncbi:BTAD domain-containing putative transcriptional regulator [Nonomuraea sp. NEAU-A123]|uniref:AfsR/SARP family transcriptional regulator n=1 Tax=Nonomuraea sp. NEAU-A123 TaxID=2839649 RepID=UPI001BE43BC8|nr:BTAD domain-containing putative transcriptional regulator [Nonomuraea sp. NEAU-A123]MBT2231530.1 tetratricopeptide repeat protein [Nonomuraea sp. NEAU-A123]